jgi:hypothetical protein
MTKTTTRLARAILNTRPLPGQLGECEQLSARMKHAELDARLGPSEADRLLAALAALAQVES